MCLAGANFQLDLSRSAFVLYSTPCPNRMYIEVTPKTRKGLKFSLPWLAEFGSLAVAAAGGAVSCRNRGEESGVDV